MAHICCFRNGKGQQVLEIMETDEVIWILGICALSAIGLGILLMVLVKAYNKITCGMCHSFRSMRGKTVIITGANGGIGKEITLDMALREAKVIMACRNLASSREVAEEVIRRTGNHKVVVKYLDLSSLSSVRTFAEDILKSESRLDVLIHNAGVAGIKSKTQTSDNLELMFATNYVGPFLLTNLLSDLLKKSAPARIVHVASIVYMFGKIRFDNLNSEKSYNRYLTYCNTQLALLLITKELGSRLQGSGVTVNALHPGMVDTDIFRHLFFLLRWIIKLNMWLFFKTPKEGAQTAIFLAISEKVEGVTGKYFADCKEKKEFRKACDMEVAKRLWEESEKHIQQNVC